VLVSGIIIVALLILLSVPVVFLIAFITASIDNKEIKTTQKKQTLLQENYWRQNR
jgi:hypothetical protein